VTGHGYLRQTLMPGTPGGGSGLRWRATIWPEAGALQGDGRAEEAGPRPGADWFWVLCCGWPHLVLGGLRQLKGKPWGQLVVVCGQGIYDRAQARQTLSRGGSRPEFPASPTNDPSVDRPDLCGTPVAALRGANSPSESWGLPSTDDIQSAGLMGVHRAGAATRHHRLRGRRAMGIMTGATRAAAARRWQGPQ